MQVFWNVDAIIKVNTRLRDALTKRQKQYAIVERIGDILLECVRDFDPFVAYGSHQLWGKWWFEKEKSSNPAFAHFVEVSCLWKPDVTLTTKHSCILLATFVRLQRGWRYRGNWN